MEKLIYTMKTLHTVTKPTQFPEFWDEEWLKLALEELETRKLSPEEKASLEILIARNAEAVKAESRKIKAAELNKQLEIARNLCSMGLDNAAIANATGLRLEQIEELRKG